MGRDFRLRSYNEYRARFKLNPLASFDQLTKDEALRERLKSLYGSIDRLEFFVGIFAEDHDAQSLFGELMTKMVAYDAFTQIFSNPLLAQEIFNERTFTAYGMDVIRETDSVQKLVDRNQKAGQQARASLGVS